MIFKNLPPLIKYMYASYATNSTTCQNSQQQLTQNYYNFPLNKHCFITINLKSSQNYSSVNNRPIQQNQWSV